MNTNLSSDEEQCREIADLMIRDADAILDMPLDDIESTSMVPCAVVGLCRAAFAQSKVIALMAKTGMLHATAPNQRLLWELISRLAWLASYDSGDREQAVKIMSLENIEEFNKAFDFIKQEGIPLQFDKIEIEFPEFYKKGTIQHAEKTMREYATAPHGPLPSLQYLTWRTLTQISHATRALAYSYVEENDQHKLVPKEPEISNQELLPYWGLQFRTAVTTSQILIAEGCNAEISMGFFETARVSGDLPKYLQIQKHNQK